MTYQGWDSQLAQEWWSQKAWESWYNIHYPPNTPRVQDTKQTMNESKHTSASDYQVGGDHYKKCKIEPWDYTIANDLDYFQGSIIKYVTRWKDKGWILDLYKARQFLDKYIETMEEKHKGLKERPE